MYCVSNPGPVLKHEPHADWCCIHLLADPPLMVNSPSCLGRCRVHCHCPPCHLSPCPSPDANAAHHRHTCIGTHPHPCTSTHTSTCTSTCRPPCFTHSHSLRPPATWPQCGSPLPLPCMHTHTHTHTHTQTQTHTNTHKHTQTHTHTPAPTLADPLCSTCLHLHSQTPLQLGPNANCHHCRHACTCTHTHSCPCPYSYSCSHSCRPPSLHALALALTDRRTLVLLPLHFYWPGYLLSLVIAWHSGYIFYNPTTDTPHLSTPCIKIFHLQYIGI